MEHKPLEKQIDDMLSVLPPRDEIEFNDAIMAAWKREGPLTVADFRNTARDFGLPLPNMDEEKTALKIQQEKFRFVWTGQFDLQSLERCGIIRKVSHDGDMLAEMCMLGDKPVGLSRHFNRTGCVAYLVHDTNGSRIN